MFKFKECDMFKWNIECRIKWNVNSLIIRFCEGIIHLSWIQFNYYKN